MTDLTAALWSRFRDQRDLVARAELLDRHLGLVYHAAREIARQVPPEIDLDDLIGAGTLGLVQALEGFDTSRGLAFSTYAMPRIRGAILDDLRRRDWTPRGVRARRRLIQDAHTDLMQQFGRTPAAEEMAARLEVDLATYWRWQKDVEGATLIALDEPLDSGSGETGGAALEVADPAAIEPHEALERAEVLESLREALGSLPERDRLVLALYYHEELNLKQIGEVLHVTESRVSQIRTRALARMRERIQSERREAA